MAKPVFFLTLLTLGFSYLVATNPNQLTSDVRIGNDTTNFTGNATASGAGLANGTASGSGPNGTASLSIGSVGSASGVTFETGQVNGPEIVSSVGTGVSGTGNGFGTGSSTGDNATVSIITAGLGNGTAGHIGMVIPAALPIPPPTTTTTTSTTPRTTTTTTTRRPTTTTTTTTTRPVRDQIQSAFRKRRHFFYIPTSYGSGGYYPYFSRHYGQ